jgi:3-dehydroquinate dehydratase I
LARKQIGNLEIGRVPRIVGVVTRASTLKRIPQLKNPPFDIVEVRLDLIGPDKVAWAEICSLIERRGIPIILTVRSAVEGGMWTGEDRSRLGLYLAGLRSVSAVDVEIRSSIFSAVAVAARKAGKAVIASFHDFKTTPARIALKRVVALGRRRGARVVKVATQIRRAPDTEVLLRLLREERDKGAVCVIGMGRLGAGSRVSLACEGSCLTYGFVDRSAAPGQFSCRVLAKRLRRECRVGRLFVNRPSPRRGRP